MLVVRRQRKPCRWFVDGSMAWPGRQKHERMSGNWGIVRELSEVKQAEFDWWSACVRVCFQFRFCVSDRADVDRANCLRSSQADVASHHPKTFRCSGRWGHIAHLLQRRGLRLTRCPRDKLSLPTVKIYFHRGGVSGFWSDCQRPKISVVLDWIYTG